MVDQTPLPTPPSGKLAQAVERIHPSRHRGLSHALGEIGIWSTIAFIALIMMIPVVPQVLYPIHKWLGYWYLVTQLLEMVARNPITFFSAMKDHAVSFVSWMMAFALLILSMANVIRLTSEGSEILHFWFGIATLGFWFGILMAFRVLDQPYQRRETETRG